MPPVIITPVANSIPFDNSTNGFESEMTQQAIEEAKTKPPDISIDDDMTIIFDNDGDWVIP